jgi:hypothetical protein
MPRLIFAFALLWIAYAGFAHAQPAPSGPDPQFVQNALAALQQQRNNALDQAAQAQAQLAVAQSQLASTKKELDALKAANAPKNYTPVPENK